MNSRLEKILDDLGCEVINAFEAKKVLEKMKSDVSDRDYREAHSLISDYLYEQSYETEPEVSDLIIEEAEVSPYNWDEDEEEFAWSQKNCIFEE